MSGFTLVSPRKAVTSRLRSVPRRAIFFAAVLFFHSNSSTRGAFLYIVIIIIFAWDDVNREHLAKHNVPPEDVEDVVANAQEPYPMEIGDEKLVVWGQTIYGRYL